MTDHVISRENPYHPLSLIPGLMTLSGSTPQSAPSTPSGKPVAPTLLPWPHLSTLIHKEIRHREPSEPSPPWSNTRRGPSSPTTDDRRPLLIKRSRTGQEGPFIDEFLTQKKRLTADLIERYGTVVVCRSLSKAHCLLGARVGYAVTSAANADRLRHHRLPYAVNSLSPAAAEAALGDPETLAQNVAASRQAMAALNGCLDRIGLRYAPSQANFLLIDLGDRRDQILDVLRARGLRFRDGGRWQLPTMVQVHVIDAPSTAALISAFAEI